MLFVFYFALIAAAQYEIPECMNNGKPILTRTNYEPYMLRYQCLCPFDFYGDQCQQHRGILCLTNNNKVISYDIRSLKRNAKLSYDMTCLLVDIPTQNTDSPTRSYKKLPLTKNQIEKQYQKSNYYIPPDYDIIWVNDTSIFQQDGTFINPNNDTRSEQQIFNDSFPYQFTYQSNFLGVPLSKSSIVYSLQSFRFKNSTVSLGEIVPIVTPILDQQDLAIAYKVLFSVETTAEMQEFGVTRLQMSLTEYYGPGLIHEMMMDHPRWLLNNPNIPKGKYLARRSGLSSSLLLILVSISIVMVIFLAHWAIQKCRKWKKSKLMMELEQDSVYNTQ